MHGLIKNNFIYIPIPKNGVMTFTTLLLGKGWEWFNFYENNLDLKDYKLWGHLTDPNKRHTRGVEQYLRLNPDIDINNPQIAKMLVSGLFDQHGYSVHAMLGSAMFYPINWIPLDAKIVDWNSGGTKILTGNDLTNDFFANNNMSIAVTSDDVKNATNGYGLKIQNKIEELKKTYEVNYNMLVGNMLDPDIILYNKVVKDYRMKYGSKE